MLSPEFRFMLATIIPQDRSSVNKNAIVPQTTDQRYYGMKLLYQHRRFQCGGYLQRSFILLFRLFLFLHLRYSVDSLGVLFLVLVDHIRINADQYIDRTEKYRYEQGSFEPL